MYCDCGNKYHIVNDKCLRNHNPNCGVDIEDEEVGVISFERINFRLN